MLQYHLNFTPGSATITLSDTDPVDCSMCSAVVQSENIYSYKLTRYTSCLVLILIPCTLRWRDDDILIHRHQNASHHSSLFEFPSVTTASSPSARCNVKERAANQDVRVARLTDDRSWWMLVTSVFYDLQHSCSLFVILIQHLCSCNQLNLTSENDFKSCVEVKWRHLDRLLIESHHTLKQGRE